MSGNSTPLPERPVRVETASPGVFVDVGAIARDAAIQTLKETDAPIASADDLVALVTGPALKATVAMRVGQVVRHGYTPDGDLMLPIGLLVTETITHAQRARAAIGTTEADRDLVAARQYLASTAALCWAALDRLDGGKLRGER